MTVPPPRRGEVWLVQLDPPIGREQSGLCPALVLSVDSFNHGPAEMVVLLPVTSKNKRQPFHVTVEPPEGGLRTTSFVKCDDLRSASKERLRKRLGAVSSDTTSEVEERVRILLGL